MRAWAWGVHVSIDLIQAYVTYVYVYTDVRCNAINATYRVGGAAISCARSRSTPAVVLNLVVILLSHSYKL